MRLRCVNRAFRDLVTEGKPIRKVGEEWDAPASRLAEINSAGYGIMAEEVAAKPSPSAEAGVREAKPEVSKMTKAELLDEAEARGIEVPQGATKAEIAELVGE